MASEIRMQESRRLILLGYSRPHDFGLERINFVPGAGTPSFVNPTGGVVIGLLAGSIPYFSVSVMKPRLGYDDALDTFGVHAVGGTLGAILTGILATKEVNGNLKDNLLATLFRSQLKAVCLTIILSVVATFLIALAVKGLLGLRAALEVESAGLDISEHGEEGYVL